MNKLILGFGVVSALGMLLIAVFVWVALLGAPNEEPPNLQAAESPPVRPTPPPTPQEKQAPQANSHQEDLEAEAELRKRFKEGMEKSRQRQQEALAQQAKSNTNSRNRLDTGESVTFSSGLKLTAYSYSSPVQSDSQFLRPKAGTQFATIDVEGCAGSNLGGAHKSLNPFDFSLQMPNNTRIGPTMPVVDPALHHTDLLPGECVRGLVSFQVPEGQDPSYVRFNQVFPEEIAKWTVK